MTQASEMPRWIGVRQADGKKERVVATPHERAALARRFGLVSVERLEAEVTLGRDGSTIAAEGHLAADIVQICAVSGENLAVAIREPLHFAFVPDTGEEEAGHDIEVELAQEELDEIPYSGDRFDLGEAIAQSLGLAIDPYATGPDAETVRREVGLAEPGRENPFAKLAALKKD